MMTNLSLLRALATLSVLAIAASALPGCSSSESAARADSGPSASSGTGGEGAPDAASAPRALLPVEAVVVERAPFVVEVRGTGRVEAVRRAELTTSVSEKITGVHVQEGARVNRGDVLVTLDDRSLSIARNEAKARAANAESDYRIRLLSDTKLTDERRELIAHRAGFTEAREQLARTELDLEDTRIVAPFSGTVGRVVAVLGERAQPGEMLATIVDLDVVRVRAEILETSFAEVRPGAGARVRFAAFPGEEFEGTVSALLPELDADRGTGVALVTIENSQGRIRPGMYAEVEIEGSVFDDRIAVPRSAVLERDHKLLVFRASGGRAEWEYVQTGRESTRGYEITHGLAAGDTVLVAGHLTLAHGAPVKVQIASH